jgi:hypothetical protein
MNSVDGSFEPSIDKFHLIAMMKKRWLRRNLSDHYMSTNLLDDERINISMNSLNYVDT